ncbi:protein ASYMMETRIC LEAVES 2-like [Nicotiana tabacum]|uniref:LOB domain-containing protein 27-like n=2 Tax=Nicotiana TaxID=4085 RepID=A0A1S3ZNI0_TOBAC|nr:PREDICTED: LOB domain-containing protein 27-like [Nicotiana sylvestris]XP_016466095.1 PREDICTED: LOB domain-containing protein 27-like [Nicotiana tabacum]
MQKINGRDTAACASCKHQRKKCANTCILAPYFPAEKSREFQAVHKIFGVSNVAKLIKTLIEEDRKKAADSLVWEAFCRQKNPVLGSYGEYRRVVEELKLYKSQYQQILQIPTQGATHDMMYNAAQGLNNGYNKKANSMMESWLCSNNIHLQHVQNNMEKLTSDCNGSTIIVPQQAIDGFTNHYYLTAGNCNPIDVKRMENSSWEASS